MGLLRDKDKELVKSKFEAIEGPVTLVCFTQEIECDYCSETRELLEDLVELSDKLSLEVYDFAEDPEEVEIYGVDKIPAVAVVGDEDYGIRFYGVPAGYEFTALIEDILDVSRGKPDLDDEIVERLGEVDKPVHMQVMVTPTCPYCPRAVRTAHRFAMTSRHIRGDMVEVSEFPHIAVKYNVRGVPNTIINEEHSVLGAQPEKTFLEEVLAAIGKG